ncbi:MAG: hypothetical protein Q9207_005191 [Kuettlingeria erythrocarpa]
MAITVHSQSPVRPMKVDSSPLRTSFDSQPSCFRTQATYDSSPSIAHGSPQAVPSSPQLELTAHEAIHIAGAAPPDQSRDKTSPRRLNLPPPPKAGEKLRPPDFHALRQSAPAQERQAHHRHTYSTQASSRPWSVAGPVEIGGSEQPVATRVRAQSMAEGTIGGHIEHAPVAPGYVQDPYALEMTAEQRFTTEQDDHDEQGLPLPNNTHRRGQSTASIEEIWKIARRNTEGIIDGIQEWLANPRKAF